MAEHIDRAQTVERRFADRKNFEEGCVPNAKSGTCEGWREPCQVRQDVQNKNPRPWRNDKFKLPGEGQLQITGQDFKMAARSSKNMCDAFHKMFVLNVRRHVIIMCGSSAKDSGK